MCYYPLSFKSKELLNIVLALRHQGAFPRLIGGCVRDKLLGFQVQDIDLATPLTPDTVTLCLQKVGISPIPTGVKHGTVTAIHGGEKFEITTLRKDIKCYGRRAEVVFTEDFRTDALRRDFTINALSYCVVKQELYDYHNGLSHLKALQVKFIGDPYDRIREDALRILRFFRFSAYYAKEMDKSGYEMCIYYRNLLNTLSKERIVAEFNKILLSPKADIILVHMLDGGILRRIIPDVHIDITNLTMGLEYSELLATELLLATRYAVILAANNSKHIIVSLKNLKLPNHMVVSIRDLAQFIANIHNEHDARYFLKKAYLVDPLNFVQYLIMALSYQCITVQEATALHQKLLRLKKNMPINGRMLGKLGYKGREIGNELEYLKKLWIDSDFKLSKEQLLTKVR